ncbi:MAG: hypothetical protein GY903_05325 [Fuerstiella sp.]|nr:hypothetical protein [Fuerstiella sp.]MCP4853896.1 hypothetical protein [Fuerstiella sp.]
MTLQTSKYTDLRLTPPFDEWAELLAINALDNSRLDDLRTAARQRLVSAAENYVLRLHALVDDADLPANSAPVLTGQPAEQPIVLTGHQPVVFHSGLTFKYETTEQLAADAGAIAVAVMIDTDSGDAGQFSYPQADALRTDDDCKSGFPGSATLEIESLAVSNSLFAHGRLKSAAELHKLGDLVASHLNSLSQPGSESNVVRTFREFAQLSAAKTPAAEANTIVRRQRGIGSRMLELPLSAISAFPEMLAFTADILKQARRFAAAYNASLEVFRDENGIRNRANPFPNLKITEESCELPFWAISHDRKTRHVLEVQFEGNVTRLTANNQTIDSFTGSITAESLEPMLLQNIQIVPRGAMITASLRLLFSDLFVHGTGGGRYDRFTDEFIRTWWNVEPPPYAVASASRYLLVADKHELERLDRIRHQLRDLQYNPQRHFDSSVFSEELKSRLLRLCDAKAAAVENMKLAHASGQSAKDIGTTIQVITNQVRDEVSAEFEPQLRRLTSLSAEHRDATNCRTYPWFMFS